MTDPKKNPGKAGSGRREAAWGEVSDWLDDWIAMEPDGNVTAFSGKVELGTGVRTALAQIVAEELDVPVERVHMVMGDTDRTPNEGYTAGSMTISGSGTALRRAAARRVTSPNSGPKTTSTSRWLCSTCSIWAT